jgi:hypothetical protein
MKKLLVLSFMTVGFCIVAFAQQKNKRLPKKTTAVKVIKSEPLAPQTDAQKAAAELRAIKAAEAAKKS